MKNVFINVLNADLSGIRIKPLVDSICRGNSWHIRTTQIFDLNYDADIWMIDYPDILISEGKSPIEFLNNLETQFLNYKGKIVLYSLHDGFNSPHIGLKDSIIDRIDSWIIYSTDLDDEKNICQKIRHKYISIPRYLISPIPIPLNMNELRKSYKIYFKGMCHGFSREEPIKQLKNNPLLNEVFVGGLYGGDVPIEIFSPQLTQQEYREEMLRHKISLCLPGWSNYCYRHIEAMAYENAIISPDITKGGDWMYSNIINEHLYIYKEDMSDFLDVCFYALVNYEETFYRAKKLNDIYNTYLKLMDDGGYLESVWIPIKSKLESLGFDI